MSSRALADQQQTAPSTTAFKAQSVGAGCSSECSQKAWTPAAIASSIVGTFTRSYSCFGDATPHAGTDQQNRLSWSKDGDDVEDALPEYTSEHLEKALVDLRSTVNDNEIEETKEVVELAVVEETVKSEEKDSGQITPETAFKETMSRLPESSEIQMSTEITYPAIINQIDQINEFKPVVETISTQSSSDRVKLSTQTTTEDLPRVPQVQIPVAPISPPASKLDATVSERHLRKSKVPVLKPDHASRTASSTSIFSASSQIRIKNTAGSRIPQRMATSLSPSRECISSIPSKTILNPKWPAQQRNKNARICDRREQILQNAISAPSVKITKSKNAYPSPSRDQQRYVSEQVSPTSSRHQHVKQRRDTHVVINPPLGYKIAAEVQLQTDQIPPCGSNHRLKKEEGRSEIEQICQNLIDNILNVEQALDNLPRADVATLSALCAAYNCVMGQHSETTTNNPPSDVKPQLKKNLEDEKIESVEEVSESKQEPSNTPIVQPIVLAEPESVPVATKKPEVKVVPEDQEADKETTKPTESVDTIHEVETDDDYEDYDDTVETNDSVRAMNKMEDTPGKMFTDGKSLARESRTCIVDSSRIIPINPLSTSESLLPKAVPKHTDIIRASVELNSVVLEQPVALPTTLPTTVSFHEITKPISSRTFMVITKPKTETKSKPEEVPVKKESVSDNDNANVQYWGGFQRSREDLAIEANLFNMIQSQKINNILRFAMPHNETLLPVFVSSPSSIIHTLELEMLHTLETKKMYYCAIAHTPERDHIPTNKIASAGILISKKEHALPKRNENEETTKLSASLSYGAIIGTHGVAQYQATWTKPPFYYGESPMTCAK